MSAAALQAHRQTPDYYSAPRPVTQRRRSANSTGGHRRPDGPVSIRGRSKHRLPCEP